jgi:hypothetical protein
MNAETLTFAVGLLGLSASLGIGLRSASPPPSQNRRRHRLGRLLLLSGSLRRVR